MYIFLYGYYKVLYDAQTDRTVHLSLPHMLLAVNTNGIKINGLVELQLQPAWCM